MTRAPPPPLLSNIHRLRVSYRVVQAGLRPFLHRKSSGGYTRQGGGGYGQPLGYDAFVFFYLCEVALVMGTCSKRDVRYCFGLVDATGHGRIGVSEITPFREEMVLVLVLVGAFGVLCALCFMAIRIHVFLLCVLETTRTKAAHARGDLV